MRAIRTWASIAVATGLLTMTVGCGDDSGGTADEATAPETVTVESTVTEETSDTTDEQPPPDTTDKPPPTDSGGGSITVPNVEGKDHQLAQDEMQAAGLYILKEKDCTGQDRLLLYDRNWTVVKQSPPAGSKVSEDDTITLCSKKDGE